MKYSTGGRDDVLLAQPVARHCSGYGEDFGSSLHLHLRDAIAATSMAYNCTGAEFIPPEEGLR